MMYRWLLVFLLAVGAAAPALADVTRGIEAFRGGDYAEALTQLRPAAAKGDGRAQFYLGRMHAAGLGGLKKDKKKATAFYRQAAENDIAPAQHDYGAALALGDGVEQNMVEALKWFLLASRSGVVEARAYGDRIARFMTRQEQRAARRAARKWREARAEKNKK
jgi:TPR repeat protein